MFEPQKIFIGLVDFFAIFLPGAVLAYFGKNWGARKFLGYTENISFETLQGLVIFLFASYLLGHLIFLLGAFIDEWLYDPLRSATRLGQIGRLANGKRLSPYLIRRLAESELLFGPNADAAVIKVLQLKAKALQPLSAGRAVNAYQWCRALLSKQHPDGFLAVQRFEADSKFFRSFAIVLPILAAAAFYKYFKYSDRPKLFAALVCLALLLPALLRYMDQRFKGTQHAYWLVITLESLNPQKPSASARRNGPTHAGGVVYKKGNPVQYLLVESSKKNGEWVLPKGHIEPGENPRETAVREVLEETGCWARVVQWIGKWNLAANTHIFLMEFVEEEQRDRPKTLLHAVGRLFLRIIRKYRPLPVHDEERSRDSLPLAAAGAKASFDDTKKLLVKAEEMRLREAQKQP